MMPEEFEHTREPTYDRDIYWPSGYQLRPFSSLNTRSEASEAGEASGSQDGNNVGEISSPDTTPPSEEGVQQEIFTAKIIAEPTTIDSAPPLQQQPNPGENVPHMAQASSSDMSITVDLRNPTPLGPSFGVVRSEHVVAGFDNHVSETQLHSSKLSVAKEVTVTKSEVASNEHSESALKPNYAEVSATSSIIEPTVSAAEADLQLPANSFSPEQTSTSVINVEDAQDRIEPKTLASMPSVAISCPTRIFPTDPPSTRLRHMIANSPSIITCPGVYDGLSARIALHVGFKGLYMTGAGTTASVFGASDLGIAHLHEMRTNAEMIANLSPDGPPLIADMDTGYGGPLIISRAVKQYARAGVAAFHIEDQVPEKRCGHLSGKEVVDTETYLRRIRACLDARAQIRSDIIIIARTDALQSLGYSACIERLCRARDIGADMGILEGVASKEDAAQAVKDLAPWPLCYNSVENGHSPLITVDEAQAMGYRVMIFSFAGIAPAYTAIMETFTKLKVEGVTGSIVGPKKIFEVCGLAEEIRIDEACGGKAFAKGV